ncbi:MAG TPA: DUF899 family protein [Candidatus Cloacimonadota bacterium]|nr:DUF899 family protein [Candidatus Cloacimonadota bacterium]
MTEIEKQITALEQEIIQKKQDLYKLKKTMPSFELQDYELIQRDGSKIRLSELFGTKDQMILVHNMGASCPYCTLWADGFKGIHKHLEDQAAFVISTPDAPEAMDRFASSRDWQFKVVSTSSCTLKKDLGFELENGSYYPGVSTLFKDSDGKIWHVAKAFFGPGDDFCALWYFFDMLKEPDPDWVPKYSY